MIYIHLICAQGLYQLVGNPNHIKDFPNLARLARQYLGVSATSMIVERLFSVVGFAFADRRKRASTETLWPTSPSLSSKLNLPTAKLQ